MHLPMRRFIRVSHRGSIVCGRAGGFSVDLRVLYTGVVVESRRCAEKGVAGLTSRLRMACCGNIVVVVGGMGLSRGQGAIRSLGPELGQNPANSVIGGYYRRMDLGMHHCLQE